MKRILSLFCCLALLFSLAACGSSGSEEASVTSTDTVDRSNTTVTGQVTDMNGTVLTLTLGELTEVDMTTMGGGSMGGDMAQKGEGETMELPEGTEMGEMGEGMTMPEGETMELPEGTEMGEMGEGMTMPEGETMEIPEGTEMGEMGETMTIPEGETMELPEGTEVGEMGEGMTMPEGTEMGDGQQMGEGMGDGTAPTGDGTDMGQMGGDMDFSAEASGMTMYTFTAGEETATIDIQGAEITDALTGNITEVTEGDVVVIQIGDNNTVTSVTIQTIVDADSMGEMGEMGDMSEMGEMGEMGGSFGGSSTVEQGTAANEITEDGTWSDIGYSSTGDDENALRITGATVTLDTVAIDKSEGASSNSETGDFYGMNAALLVTDGANVTMTNCWIESSAQNGNGVFCYGTGTVVTISDTTIITTADNSGGIQTTGGGTTYASNLTIETSGSSSAAIRSDRGGGTVVVEGGTYTSNGFNSPAVYSTADITVSNATLTANNSEALVIEGKNSITLNNCITSGTKSALSSSSKHMDTIMIYQSMSGDADVGTSYLTISGGSLTGGNGDLIYVTNTDAVIVLSGVSIVNNGGGNLLTISGNNAENSNGSGWGTTGANGGNVTMTTSDQILEGDVTVDTISTLDWTMESGTDFTGTINIVDNEDNGTAAESNAVITLSSGATWTLTGDCTITSLDNSGTIHYNGYTITLADGTVLSE